MPYTIEEIKKIVEPIAKKHSLKSVWLFGSYARGEATDSSDVDIVVDLDGTDINTIFKTASLCSEFEDAFTTGVDMIENSTLYQRPMRPSVADFNEAVFNERVKIYDKVP